MADGSTKKTFSNLPFPNPFDVMRETMNRMMDVVFEPISRGIPVRVQWKPSGFQPSLDVFEDDENVRVLVEVPGMTADDLSITVSEDSLTLRGKKRQEDEEGHDVHRRERSHGQFRRVIPLPAKIDRDRVQANFKNGVLTVILPKSPETGRRISIRVEDD